VKPVRVALAAAALSLVASGCVLPNGVVLNGRLPDHMLRTVTPECRIAADLADPLVAMIGAARAEGIFLWPETSAFLPPGEPTPPRIESCYRTFEMQQWWRMYWCSKGNCGIAAVPGESRHGWGRAVDFQDRNGEVRRGSAAHNWLLAHAAEYGFYERPGESWHWDGRDAPVPRAA
jgi:hypothetical protein